MKTQAPLSVCGVIAPPARPTPFAAALVATTATLPAAVLFWMLGLF